MNKLTTDCLDDGAIYRSVCYHSIHSTSSVHDLWIDSQCHSMVQTCYFYIFGTDKNVLESFNGSKTDSIRRKIRNVHLNTFYLFNLEYAWSHMYFDYGSQILEWI